MLQSLREWEAMPSLQERGKNVSIAEGVGGDVISAGERGVKVLQSLREWEAEPPLQERGKNVSIAEGAGSDVISEEKRA